MNIEGIQQALTTLSDYFAAGNDESDAAAKAVLVADSAYDDYWRPEVEQFQRSAEWTGVRAPEAELLVHFLRQASEIISSIT